MARPDRSRGADSRKLSNEDRSRLQSTSIDRGTILDRYRTPSRTAPSPGSREKTHPSSGSDLSRLRGVQSRQSAPSTQTGGKIGPARGAGSRLGTSPKESAGSRSAPSAGTRERTRAAEANARKGLARKFESDPKAGREILQRGKFTSAATDVATRTALGVGVAVATGGSSTSCFWDPCASDTSGCGQVCNWWCTPGWSWWWSTCCSPWYGWGWGFGYWSDCFGFWYGGCPSYGYGYGYPYYAPYPAYYSSVIYDSYEQPPAESVAEPSYVEPAPEVAAEGEGVIRVAGGAGDLRPRLGPAAEFLSLGDQAFREGRYSEAVHYYAKAVELEPDQGVLHLILSDALFATGDYHYAAYSLRRALELDPTVVDSVVDKHAFYTDPGEFDRQVQILERYLGDHFLDDDARLLLSANYLFGGQAAQAADLLQSPFSVAIRESGAGRILLDRAEALRRGNESGTSPR
jgi:hypothetical protein